jgi:hypothetical protein
MANTFNRAKYVNIKGSFEIRNYFDDTLYKKESVSTIPTDTAVTPDVNGDYIGVYYIEGDRFISDNWYDNSTGWLWPSGLTWDNNMARTL